MGNEVGNTRNMQLVCSPENLGKSQNEIEKKIDEYLYEKEKFKSVITEQNQNAGDDDNLPLPNIIQIAGGEGDKEVNAEEKDHLPHPSIAKKLGNKPSEVVNALARISDNDENNKGFDDPDLRNRCSGFFNFGESYFKFNDNSYYVGYWYSRKRNGVGSQIWIKDDSYLLYEGFWEDDVPNIKGVIKMVVFDSKSNDTKYFTEYNGEIQYFRKEGNGHFVKRDFENNLVCEYDGSWKMNKKDGSNCVEKLFERYSNDPLYTYKGDFEEGKKKGFGRITFMDGGSYEGSFKDDKMWGKGIYKFPTGQVYDGEFVENRMEGFGKLTLGENKIYEGSFLADYMHGKGKLEWPSERRKKLKFTYDGDWLMGVQHGKGELASEYKEKHNSKEEVWQYGEIGEANKN